MSETKKSDFPSDLGAWYMKAWKDAVNNEHCGPTESKMSETKKHREFWIRFRIGDNQNIHQITDVSLSHLGPYPEDFHTIEYSALLEEKQKVKELVKCLIETTIIDDVNWQKKNKDCLDLALHGIANNLYRLIKKYGDV